MRRHPLRAPTRQRKRQRQRPTLQRRDTGGGFRPRQATARANLSLVERPPPFPPTGGQATVAWASIPLAAAPSNASRWLWQPQPERRVGSPPKIAGAEQNQTMSSQQLPEHQLAKREGWFRFYETRKDGERMASRSGKPGAGVGRGPARKGGTACAGFASAKVRPSARPVASRVRRRRRTRRATTPRSRPNLPFL